MFTCARHVSDGTLYYSDVYVIAARVSERDDSDDERLSGDDDSDDDDDVPYNPKNLPLGWDGKPIPYWLYKLHGLNISYTCEICGNYTYRGPKAFQRHFAVSFTSF